MAHLIITIMQNYCFMRKLINKNAPMMAGNKKLTAQMMVLKHISIKLLL
jgi:beta-lactamase class D